MLIARLSCSCLNVSAHLHESALVRRYADGSPIFCVFAVSKGFGLVNINRWGLDRVCAPQIFARKFDSNEKYARFFFVKAVICK